MDATAQVLAARTKRLWIFVHILAFLTAITAGLLFALALVGLPNHGATFMLSFTLVRVYFGLGTIALFWFWVRMLIDYFAHRPISHPVLWGFLITLGSYLGALAYFWLVWRPRNKTA